MTFIGFHQQRAERVYRIALTLCIMAIMAVTNYATAVWAMRQPDPKAMHCYAAMETMESWRVAVSKTPAYQLPLGRK